MMVHARAQGDQLAEGPIGLEVGKRVLAPGLPAGAVELVQVGHAGPVADQPVPARVGPEVRLAVEPLVDILVDVVVRDVAGEIERSLRKHELGGEVLALVPCGALHPVGRLLPDRGDPGPRRAAEHRSGLDPCGEALALVLADRDGRCVAPLRRRVGCQEIERAPQRLDRPGGDVGGPLRHLDASEVHRVDEPARLRAAPVIRRAIGESVDGGADLYVVDRRLEPAHGDVARPVVKGVRVPLLDGYAGKVVDHRRHGGDVRLLPDHRLRDEIAREDRGLLRHHAQRIEPESGLQNDRTVSMAPARTETCSSQAA